MSNNDLKLFVVIKRSKKQISDIKKEDLVKFQNCYIYLYQEDCIKKSCIEIPFFFCVYIIYKTVYINLSTDCSLQLLPHN